MDEDIRLEQVLEQVDKLARINQHSIGRDAIFPCEVKSIPGRFSLSMEPTPVQFDVDGLEKTTLAAMADYTFYSINNTHRTNLLKNTPRPEVMLLDRIHSVLPDYRFLRCVAIDSQGIHFQFKNHLDIDALKEIAQSATVTYRVNLESSKTQRGFNQTIVSFNNVPVLTIKDYTISLPYGALAQNDMLGQGVQASAELVARVHQDSLFRVGIKKIHFAEYQPIFKLLFPDLFVDKTTGILNHIRELAVSGQLAQSPEFKETRNSMLYSRENKKYLFDKDKTPEHLEYIVACPDKGEVYIRFGSNFDYVGIQEMLRTQELHLTADRAEPVKHHKVIKKGGGSGVKEWTGITAYKYVLDENGTRLVTLCGDHILRLYHEQDDLTFERAARVFARIYYGRLFYTSSMPTAEMCSDISKDEKMLVYAADSLASFYTQFLQVEEERSYSALGKFHSPTPLAWVAQKMSESPAQDFESMVLHVLQEINKKVDPNNFAKYGREKDTQARLLEHYNRLGQLTERFHAAVALKSGPSVH